MKPHKLTLSNTIILVAIASIASFTIGSAKAGSRFTKRDHQNQEIITDFSDIQEEPQQQQQQYAPDKKCRPLLGSFTSNELKGTSKNNPNHTEKQSQQQQQQQQTTKLDEFSFTIGDIDMNLESQQGFSGPLQSAMKFLSVIEKQIYGDDEEEDESENDDSNSDLEMGQENGQSFTRKRTKNMIQFQENKLHLSGLNLSMLNVHLYNLSEPRFALGVNVKNTTLYGKFHYNGPTPTLLATTGSAASSSELGQSSSSLNGRSKLNGIYRMSIDNVLVVATSNLTKVPRKSANLNVNDFNYKLITNDFGMNISNLGYISIDILDPIDPRKPTSNYVLRMLQRVLQKTIKRIYYSFEQTLRHTMETEGRRFLDCELTRFEPLLVNSPTTGRTQQNQPVVGSLPATGQIFNSTSSTSLDDLSRIISSEINHLNLSKVSLPDFDYQRQIFATNANIYFTNGSMTGLDNFKLTGETRIKLQNQHLLMNASLGWFNMRPHYNWTLYFGNNVQRVPSTARLDNTSATDTMDITTTTTGGSENITSSVAKLPPAPTSSGFVAFNIKAIEFDAVISKGLVPRSRITIDELIIKRLDGPKMEFGGLPGMNRVARGLVNFFMGRLKQRLVGSIQPALKRELEVILNRLPILKYF